MVAGTRSISRKKQHMLNAALRAIGCRSRLGGLEKRGPAPRIPFYDHRERR